MPKLSELTDYNPMGNFTGTQPVAASVGINNNSGLDLPVKFSDDPKLSISTPLSNNVDKILNSIFRPDEKRLQLWPERLVRAGATAAGEVASGAVPQWAIDPKTGDVHTSPEMVEKAQEVSALAGSGGLASGGGSLNATPSLRPALRYKEKLYKGKPGQEHQDIIPDSLYNDFQKKAMAGQDLADYNFGFVNDKGHFLSREDALKYGIDNGIIDQQAGKFGTLTSTMFADSSKPGVAIESLKGLTREQLERLDIDVLDKAAFGYKQGEKVTLNPKDVSIKYKDDLINPQDKFDKKGMDWVKSVDFSEPVEFGIGKDGKVHIEDGHHRWFAANKLGKPLIGEITKIEGKPIEKILEYNKNLKSDVPTLPPGYELKPVDYNPFELKS